VVVATLALSGCGSGSGNAGAGAHGNGTASPPAPTPLKVVSVAPHKLAPMSPITVTFDAPVAAAAPLPTVSPAVPGTWERAGSTAVFTPSRAYPPDTTLTVSAQRLPGARSHRVAHRATPDGSLLRAEQILARLRYLPLTTSAATPSSAAAEAAAVYDPPAGSFHWRYSDVPSILKKDWTPGTSGEVLRGAVIAFQHQSHLPLDGSIGEHTWHALVKADRTDATDPDPYSLVSADLHVPQRLSVWVAGRTVLTSPVNGGVAGAPTPLGTFPVYERFTSTTMQGTNPDGSHYNDPGVPWVNYFSGGSAVHGFPRASYGFPQSVGCLELPISTAAEVYKLINYGTLVNVTGPYVAPAPTAAPAPPASSAPKHSTKPTAKPSTAASTSASPAPKKSHHR
jgi:peptidoglycan hydrolase-like protein with peptidoglycan-binding domain